MPISRHLGLSQQFALLIIETPASVKTLHKRLNIVGVIKGLEVNIAGIKVNIGGRIYMVGAWTTATTTAMAAVNRTNSESYGRIYPEKWDSAKQKPLPKIRYFVFYFCFGAEFVFPEQINNCKLKI